MSTSARRRSRSRHLLDMTSGLDWNEPLSGAAARAMLEMARSPRLGRFVLDRPHGARARHGVRLQQRQLASAVGDPGRRSPDGRGRLARRQAVRAARHRRREPGGRPAGRLAPAASASSCSRATWPRSATSTCAAARGRRSASCRRMERHVFGTPRSTMGSRPALSLRQRLVDGPRASAPTWRSASRSAHRRAARARPRRRRHRRARYSDARAPHARRRYRLGGPNSPRPQGGGQVGRAARCAPQPGGPRAAIAPEWRKTPHARGGAVSRRSGRFAARSIASPPTSCGLELLVP